MSGSWMAATPGSTLLVDYMQLKSQALPVAGVKGQVTISNNVLAYPNPANDEFNIRIGGANGAVEVKLYDMMGKVIDSKSYNDVPSLITFQVGHLPAGIYFYEVTNNGNVTREKFLKQ
jgi:hypothetical protein